MPCKLERGVVSRKQSNVAGTWSRMKGTAEGIEESKTPACLAGGREFETRRTRHSFQSGLERKIVRFRPSGPPRRFHAKPGYGTSTAHATTLHPDCSLVHSKSSAGDCSSPKFSRLADK